jgi:hypothetical protein
MVTREQSTQHPGNSYGRLWGAFQGTEGGKEEEKQAEDMVSVKIQ